ncbi:unnamed protein product [Leptidea sinapis]|uniref:FLYWCH-type domain-containing protein n=1 Tax=Leptidea sinapis TaxID=189913 RepID=A0A5E4PXA5_9NEOP|nr:unnamed protein product [Leptidea sinapis]
MSSIQYVMTSRGNRVLSYNGHKFHVNTRRGYKTYWRCAGRVAKGCTMSITTIEDNVVKVNNEHNHE